MWEINNMLFPELSNFTFFSLPFSPLLPYLQTVFHVFPERVYERWKGEGEEKKNEKYRNPQKLEANQIRRHIASQLRLKMRFENGLYLRPYPPPLNYASSAFCRYRSEVKKAKK
ncbi:hypothetical protein TNCV_3503731 [Trichonephila clavipes]|uniref:Uncharacterized protein n=1 Tax=Trichonephila clavipes TaxID=2585209 RepID=A0A8X6RVC2_TRICX|nr:hypothetical protein TNCV_3503731 [Trichonephila clavipes]